jgi:hypothetical protein
VVFAVFLFFFVLLFWIVTLYVEPASLSQCTTLFVFPLKRTNLQHVALKYSSTEDLIDFTYSLLNRILFLLAIVQWGDLEMLRLEMYGLAGFSEL